MPLLATATAPVLLAHQGGWDEILLIGGPILIIVALLRLAKRRLDAATPTPTPSPSPSPDPDADNLD